MDPDNQAQNLASQQSSSMSPGATVMPEYSCLLPDSFDGTTDFEDFVTQFSSVAFLSGWAKDPQVTCVLNSFLSASVETL